LEPSTPSEGRTHWGRSAVLLIPAMVALGGLTLAIAEGALAAPFGVSGQSFEVKRPTWRAPT
jgi:hypothetical protein